MRTEYSLCWISRSRTKILPEVGARTPVITLMRVDLPAPLSPISPTISLRPIVRSISRNACTAPKNFCTASMRTIEAKSGGAGAIVSPPPMPPTNAAHKAYNIKIGATGSAWQWVRLSRSFLRARRPRAAPPSGHALVKTRHEGGGEERRQQVQDRHG